MSLAGILMGTSRLIVGLEDDEDGSLRVYVDRRWTGIHTHVDDAETVAEFRRAWGGSAHLFADIPTSALCDCPAPSTTTERTDR